MNAKSNKRIVVKIGTSTLTNESGHVDTIWLHGFAGQMMQLKNSGYKPIIVSSGAIGCGLSSLGLTKRPKDIPTLQAAAAVGQIQINRYYAQALEPLGINIAQV
ncbi:MAG: glutamate 5-kinase, partial [Coriobacteriales bacterium]|nr:glutamate 5-kinase [Coriobacteriales bacterium]